MMKKWLKRAGYTVLVLVVLLLVTRLVLNTYWKSEYRDTLTRLQKEGLLLSKQELKERYQNENPTRDPMPVASSMNDPVEGLDKLDDDLERRLINIRWEVLDGSDLDKADEILKALQPYETDFKKIFGRSFHPIDLPWNGSPDQLKHTLSRNNLIKLIGVYTWAHLTAGHAEETENGLRTLYDLSNAFLREPVLISNSLGRSGLRRANQLLLSALQKGVSVSNKLSSGTMLPDSDQLRRSFKRALQGDPHFSHGPTGPDYGYKLEGESTSLVEWVMRPFRWKSGITLITLNGNQISLATKRYDQVQSELDKLGENLDDHALFPGTTMGAIRYPSMKRFRTSLANSVAQNQLTRFALSLLNRGVGVEQPDEIPGWSEAKDPFTGEPYRFTKKNGTITLYSVGPNQQDDGGVEGDTRDEGDLIVQIPEP